MKLLIFLVLVQFCHICVNSFTSDGPIFPPVFRPWRSISPGHMRPFGCQKPPDGPVRPYFDRFLHPIDFWKYHVKHKLPLVYPNAVSNSPAIKLWDDDYLLKNYGDLDVLVEKKVENRSFSPQRMVLKDFLKQYKTEDIYVVSVVPDAMRHEVQVIPSLLCGTFKSYLQETNLWIGSGGTKSVIHYDADHNIHCLMHGRKDFMMIHYRYFKYLYMHTKSMGSGSGWSNIDVTKVDTKKFPLLSRVPWTYATLRAGDCIFLPGGYIHQVSSYGRSISVTTLFSPTSIFNSSGCQNISMDTVSMKDVPIHWTYKKGDKTIDLGYQNLMSLHASMMELFKKRNRITKKTFGDSFSEELSPDDDINDSVEMLNDILDPANKGYITKDTIAKLSIEELKTIARTLDSPAGPLQASETIDWENSRKKLRPENENVEEDEEENVEDDEDEDSDISPNQDMKETERKDHDEL